jgi:PEGA domain
MAMVAVLVTAMASARAESRTTAVVNATGLPGVPVAARLRSILEQRRRLVRQSTTVTATLDGQPPAVPDFDEVRKALADFRYQDAERLLGDFSDQLLEGSEAGAALPLAEVLWWQGLVSAVDDRDKPPEQRRKAKLYFSLAFALNPDVTIDVTVTPPRVRLIMEEARRPRSDTGTLALTVSDADAEVSIDGAPSAAVSPDIEVPTGLHFLRVSAPGKAAVLRLVEVTAGPAVRLEIKLPAERATDKVRRLIGETASVPEGRTRMPVLTKLGAAIGARQLLLVEGVEAQRAKIRLYDVGGKRMSQQFSFAQADSASEVTAAVDRSFRLSDDEALDRRWYQRWQVWTAVGAVVAGSIAVAVVVNANQDPRIRGF